jgi:hypothetical protein
MENESPKSAGGPLAIAIILGALIGSIMHQPTIGVLAGIAVGTVVAVAIWLRDRKRIGR